MKPNPVFYLIIMALGGGFSGCASHPQLTLEHQVDVPKEFRSGCFSKEHPFYTEGDSTIERYADAYERGWNFAVQRYARNIDLDDPSAMMGSGWVEEAAGYSAGYCAGRDRIQKLIQIFGKQKVSDYLEQFKRPDEDLDHENQPYQNK